MSDPPPQLVGRAAHMCTLLDVVRGRGQPAIAVLLGEAGIGKSAVWSAVVDDRRAAGFSVLTARPTEAERALPYAGLADLLRPARGILRTLPRPQRRALEAALMLEEGAETTEPSAVAFGVVSLLERQASEQRTLIAVDDWQWLDPASVAALVYAVRRVGSDVRVLAAVRTGEPDHGLLREERATQVVLGPLDVAELRGVVEQRAATQLSWLGARELHERSRGNALTALELVRAGDRHAGAADVQALLAERFADLTKPARLVLRAAAALSAPSEALIEAAFSDPATARLGLEVALSAGLLEREGERLRVFHPLLAAVVQQRTPDSEWRELHQRLASVVDDAEQRARHLGLASVAPSGEVSAALEGAARSAIRRGAPAAGAALAERAAELTPGADPETRGGRDLLAAAAWATAGDGNRAAAAARHVLTYTPSGPVRSEALSRLSEYDSGSLPNAAEIDEAVTEAEGDAARLVEAHLVQARNVWVSGDYERAMAHLAEAERHSADDPSPARRSRVLWEVAIHRFSSGAGPQHELAHEAQRLADMDPTAASNTDSPMGQLGMMLFMTGEFEQGRVLLEADLSACVARGDVNASGFPRFQLAELESRVGRFDRALEHARESRHEAVGSALSNLEAVGLWIHGHVLAYVGQADAARDDLHGALQLTDAMDDAIFGSQVRRSLGFLELSLGDGPAAVAWLEVLPEMTMSFGAREPTIVCFQPELCEALVLAGDLDAARTAADEFAALGDELRRPWAQLLGHRSQALVAAAEGRLDDALVVFAAVLAEIDTLGQPFERARTLLHYGVALRRDKQRRAAREQLQSALEEFDALGTPLWSAKAEAELARIPGRRSTHDPDELTAGERRVADLAAAGATNREIAAELFISERTVEANLTRTYRKLGIRSRVQLAAQHPADRAADA